MIANRTNPETERPICPACKEDVLPNDQAPPGRNGTLISAPKGLFIMHADCVDLHNTLAGLLR